METELRNLKSESSQQPSLFERVKGMFAADENKSSGKNGKLDIRAQKEEDDIESVGLIDKQNKKIKGVITDTKAKI